MEHSNYYKVRESLYTFTSKYNRRPTAVVMHYEFFRAMQSDEDFKGSDIYHSLATSNKITVEGVPVYRSLDIDETIGFIIY